MGGVCSWQAHRADTNADPATGVARGTGPALRAVGLPSLCTFRPVHLRPNNTRMLNAARAARAAARRWPPVTADRASGRPGLVSSVRWLMANASGDGLGGELGAPPPPRDATVVLTSGGIESAGLLAYWTKWDHSGPLLPLFIDYGQRAAAAERRSARAAAHAAGLELVELDASRLGEGLRLLHAPARPHVPIPHRNLFLIANAAAVAGSLGAGRVALGLCRDDLVPPPGTRGHGVSVSAGAYSTASAQFLDAASVLLRSVEPVLALDVPLRSLTKAQVVSLALRSGADLETTWSCGARSGNQHCGRCAQCAARRAAFKAVGLAEPAETYESEG